MSRLLIAALAALSLPSQTVAQPAPAAKSATILPQGTRVKIVLAYGISAKAAKAEDIIYMRVFEAVVHNGRTVIPEGASVQGRVSRAVAPGSGGRPGEVVVDAEYVVTDDGRYRVTGSISTAGLDQTPDAVNGGMGGAVGGVITVPLGGRKAGNANLEAGTGFVATVVRDY